MSNKNYCKAIKIRVFSYEQDDALKILKSFLILFPEKLVKKDFSFTLEKATGFEEDEILIFTFYTEKARLATNILNNIFSHLSKEDLNLLLKQLDTRVEESKFFLRLDKDALQNGNFVITETGNCYHVKAIIPSFPASSESTIKKLQEIVISFIRDSQSKEVDSEVIEHNFKLISTLPGFERFNESLKKEKHDELYIKDTGSLDFMP